MKVNLKRVFYQVYCNIQILAKFMYFLKICKQYLNKSFKMINIKGAKSLAKHAINCVIIIIINCLSFIAIDKDFYKI